MPKRSNAFQRLVTFLEAQVAGDEVKVTESAMVAPTTGGDPKEVDILLEIPVGQRTVSVGIECRDHKRRQSRPWIEEIDGKFKNLPIDKKVAVSSSGFTRTAQKEAAERHIELLTLEEAMAQDWPAKVNNWRAVFARWHHNLVGADCYWPGDPPPLSGDELKDCQVVDSSGNGASTVGDDVLELYRLHAQSAVHEWADENVEAWSKTVPGAEEWIIPLRFTANDKWVVGPGDARYELDALGLKLSMRLEIVEAPLTYFEYGEMRLGQGELVDESAGKKYEVTMLFGDADRPKKMNIRVVKDGDARRG